MDKHDIRWVQRRHNFNKAMSHLEKAMEVSSPDMLQRAGIIQLFEMSFELAWKMLKDYLEDQGFEAVQTPRLALKKAFEVQLIQDGHGWMEMLIDRNLTTHTYDEQKAADMEALIHHKYFPLLKKLRENFNARNHEQ